VRRGTGRDRPFYVCGPGGQHTALVFCLSTAPPRRARWGRCLLGAFLVAYPHMASPSGFIHGRMLGPAGRLSLVRLHPSRGGREADYRPMEEEEGLTTNAWLVVRDRKGTKQTMDRVAWPSHSNRVGRWRRGANQRLVADGVPWGRERMGAWGDLMVGGGYWWAAGGGNGGSGSSSSSSSKGDDGLCVIATVASRADRWWISSPALPPLFRTGGKEAPLCLFRYPPMMDSSRFW
jgi:hypothetical protein